jgi:exodeoxyribonuclease-3
LWYTLYIGSMALKIATWNVNGYSQLVEAELLQFLVPDCDILCLQEIKRAQKPNPIPNYTWFWNPAQGRAHLWGTGMLVRTSLEPRRVPRSAPLPNEGRVQEVHLDAIDVSVINVYVPNSGVRQKALARLDERVTEWDPAFKSYADGAKGKSVVVCGDLNVAVRDTDVHNPKTLKRKAGFTTEERDSFRKHLGNGDYADAWTHVNGDKVGYTFWGLYPGIKESDKGWRLDYQLSRGALQPVKAVIEREHMASDHVPLVVDYCGAS